MVKYVLLRSAKYMLIVFLASFLIFYLVGYQPPKPKPKNDDVAIEELKPVIYLYPKEPLEIAVGISLKKGRLTCTYPKLNNGWNVTAQPDGTLTNHADGKEYSYLFWESKSNVAYDFSTGFVVKGSDTAKFLQEKLAYMGLMPKEYNEFIVYWLPKMENNPYNLITFQGKPYTDNAGLTVEPTPDSILRVFMAYKPLKKPVEIPEQVLQPFARRGFTVIEWGGTEVPE